VRSGQTGSEETSSESQTQSRKVEDPRGSVPDSGETAASSSRPVWFDPAYRGVWRSKYRLCNTSCQYATSRTPPRRPPAPRRYTVYN